MGDNTIAESGGLVLLRRVPFLLGLGDDDMRILGKALRARRLAGGEVLFRRGEHGDSMVITASGRLSVRVPDADGRDVEVAGIYPGEVVGEMACVDPAPRSATVVSSRESEAFELDRALLEAMQKRAPAVAVAITSGVTTYLTRRIRETNARIEQELERRGLRSMPPGPEEPATGARAASQKTSSRIDLRKIPCLKGFTNPQLEALLGVAPARAYEDGTILCREGDPGLSCFIVARGALDVVRQMGGSERILAVLETGSLAGQMALVDRAPRSATIRSRGQSVVLELQRHAFEQLLAARSQVAITFQEQIAIAGIRQLRMADQRLEALLQMAAPAARTSPRSARYVPTYAAGERPPGMAHTLRPSGSGSAVPGPDVSGSAVPGQVVPGKAVPGKGAPPRRKRQEPRQQNPLDVVHEERSEEEEMAMMLAYMQTALGEWDMSVGELDGVRVSRPAGLVSAAEEKARRGF